MQFMICMLLICPFLQVNVEIRRHSMEDLPETADGIAQWCKDVFVTKVRKFFYVKIHASPNILISLCQGGNWEIICLIQGSKLKTHHSMLFSIVIHTLSLSALLTRMHYWRNIFLGTHSDYKNVKTLVDLKSLCL